MTDTLPEHATGRSMRRRGLRRLSELLDATERLLEQDPEGGVTLAQIAQASGVPLPSLYHFFPNRNAALEALAHRLHDEIHQMAIRPLRDPEPQSWQEMLHMKHIRAAAFQNSRPAALWLFLGAGVSAAVRSADLRGNARVARSNVRFFEAYFHMPVVPDFAGQLEVVAAAVDGIWALSYGRHGLITEDYRREATHAAIASLRRILPEHLERKPLTEAALAAIGDPAGADSEEPA